MNIKIEKPLTKEEIQKLYTEFKTPEHVKRHCMGVSNTAARIAEALVAYGVDLDVELIKSTSIIHDAARIYDDHDLVISDKLDEMGHHIAADITRVHMHYKGLERKPDITETDIVCLADRLVKEDEYVGLDERMEYIINKFGRTPEREQRIYAGKKKTQSFIDMVEEITGKSIDDIVKGYNGETR